MNSRQCNLASERVDRCPVCDGSRLASLPLPGHCIGVEVFKELSGVIGLAKCRTCGLVFTNPRPSDSRLEAYYSGNTYICHETRGSASAGAKADFVLNRLQEFLPVGAPRTLLDYGAGGGGFLLKASERGWTAEGFEPGRRGMETCRSLGLQVTADAGELRGGRYSLVTLHHVFEHLAYPVRVLRDIERLLAPEGRLFIEVPNAGSLRARMALPLLSRTCNVDERYRAFPIHLMYYNDRTLRRMLEKAGWAVDATFTLGMGVDEFIARNDAAAPGLPPCDPASKEVPRGDRRFRRGLRDAFLKLGLGENLVAVARPLRAVNRPLGAPVMKHLTDPGRTFAKEVQNA